MKKLPKEVGVYIYEDSNESFLTAIDLKDICTEKSETIEHNQKVGIYKLFKIKTFVKANELV